jgi:GT2 family glycosyltransferase
MLRSITILICTHNRADLLERALASLNAATRPRCEVEILVAANACTDGTVNRLRAYQARQAAMGWISLRLIEVLTPGKANALNRAIEIIASELTAFVDDDHRVDAGFLVALEQASSEWPEAGLYCGRILPDWQGTEPSWVRDDGPWRVYPPPIPSYDLGPSPRRIDLTGDPVPGGGHLVARREVLALRPSFSVGLGPHGHDLGGGEDTDYVLRTMARGVACQYVPAMLQWHFVDPDRLRLSYVLRKSYQRSRASARVRGDGAIPLFMWRKLAETVLRCVVSASLARRRFFLVRAAGALGEIRGLGESGRR